MNGDDWRLSLTFWNDVEYARAMETERNKNFLKDLAQLDKVARNIMEIDGGIFPKLITMES